MTEPVTDDLFAQICDHVANSGDTIKETLDKFNTSSYHFYRYMGSDSAKLETFAQARVQYIEYRVQNERNRLNEECKLEIRRNPKAANAIAALYRDMIRQIEWDAEKLIPKRYGNKLDIGDNKMQITLINSTANSNNTNDTNKLQ